MSGLEQQGRTEKKTRTMCSLLTLTFDLTLDSAQKKGYFPVRVCEETHCFKFSDSLSIYLSFCLPACLPACLPVFRILYLNSGGRYVQCKQQKCITLESV